jgi:hypothetical protein
MLIVLVAQRVSRSAARQAVCAQNCTSNKRGTEPSKATEKLGRFRKVVDLVLFTENLQWVRKENPPPLHVDACAVSQLPRHLLGRFLSLQYLAVMN